MPTRLRTASPSIPSVQTTARRCASPFVASTRPGLHRPGLIFDRDLPLATREHLVSAYDAVFGPGASAPAPFITPVSTSDAFALWSRRHSFDCLLATDADHVLRLSDEHTPPVFGMHAQFEADPPARGGLSFNLFRVGSLAIRLLHGRVLRHPLPSVPASLLVPASWASPATFPREIRLFDLPVLSVASPVLH